MQDKAMGESSVVAQERQDQGAVLAHVVRTYPGSLRPSDLIQELADDPEVFGERDRIERAVRDLRAVGLLFRCDGLVLPTRAALRAFEVLSD